jgi:SAM-dependent methyltransferase
MDTSTNQNNTHSDNTYCGYCGSRSYHQLYPTSDINGNSYFICRCETCGFAFLAPRPSPEALALAYDDSYYGQSETKFVPWIESMIDYFRQGRSRRIQKYISPPANILDIGCGNGRFLGYLINKGYNGYGIERPGRSAERAAAIEELNLSTTPLGKESFPESFFDAVSLWHVFEHLEDPKETLANIEHFLKPGGYLFVSMPNITSLQSRLFKGNWLHLDPPKHLIFPGPDTFVNELKSRRFELIHQKFFSLEQNVFGIQQSLLNCVCKKREILFESLKGNHNYTQDVSKTSLFLQKLFFFFTFKFFTILALLEASIHKGGTMEMVFKKKNTD